ncbi:hypothetical protein Acr_16g0007470 [Actinidia rufa]|uniref:Uncharacterized protein n=1 Tax=Actinidia rufa TaxID=165716 RepID=A0A7J0FZL2_9ERIC|nr:hypothetical protein Acr_16g0007470 [Actinidia rufa]
MASIVANLHLPLLVHGRQPILRTLGKFTVSATGVCFPFLAFWIE